MPFTRNAVQVVLLVGDRVPRRCEKRMPYASSAPGGTILGTTAADTVVPHGTSQHLSSLPTEEGGPSCRVLSSNPF